MDIDHLKGPPVEYVPGLDGHSACDLVSHDSCAAPGSLRSCQATGGSGGRVGSMPAQPRRSSLVPPCHAPRPWPPLPVDPRPRDEPRPMSESATFAHQPDPGSAAPSVRLPCRRTRDAVRLVQPRWLQRNRLHPQVGVPVGEVGLEVQEIGQGQPTQRVVAVRQSSTAALFLAGLRGADRGGLLQRGHAKQLTDRPPQGRAAPNHAGAPPLGSTSPAA